MTVIQSQISGVTGKTKVVLLFSSMMTVMAGAIISPSLPELREHFSDIQGIDILAPLVLTIVALSIILFSPMVGILSDRIGRRCVFLISLLLYVLGGTGGLYLDSIWILLASRVVLGAGVAGIATCTLSLAADYFEGEERTGFIALITAFMGLGGVFFVFLGGFLAEAGWRYPYLLYVIPLFILPFAYFFVPDLRACKVGIAGKNMKNKKEVNRQTVILIYTLIFVGMVIFYLLPTQLPFFLRGKGIGSAVLAGSALAVLNLTQVGITLWYRSKGHRVDKKYLILLFFLFAGTANLFLSMISTYAGVIISMVIFGAGFGLLIPICNAWITDIAPDESRGKLVGGLNTAVYAGQFLSPVLAWPVVSLFGYGAPFGLYSVFGAFCMLICFAGAVVFLFFRRER
ncbi:MFS transporter [Methanoplanus sp. FWC-SCC4]|uniref:MFS transporter n=1 Tax=Methanochimaera problematica TaxID=2609417 RepID=A0AA97I3A8_9EURY|nr:MFS transporter [Methanoplanus sp. FWC-SCC4]WOF15434.1 MFS transporter [Methanoplanus sp. FWC-SCC4]